METSQNFLTVYGVGRSRYPIIPEKSGKAVSYETENGKIPVHLQFCNSTSSQQLIEFVRSYGPIWGTVRKDIRGQGRVIVRQDVQGLVREQRLFRAAVHLLIQLENPFVEKIQELISAIAKDHPRDTISEKRATARAALTSMLFHYETGSRWSGKRESRGPEAEKERLRKKSALEYRAVDAAHGTLCDLFNRFPLRLYPCSNGGIELPSYEPQGILPILYYLFRKDYEDKHHLIKKCRVCGRTFKPERGTGEFCNRMHYKKFNDRDRYLRKMHRLRPRDSVKALYTED